MQVKTRTVTVHHHYIDIEGQEFGTTLPAYEYIDPVVETEGNRTEIRYAVLDEYPHSPREDYAAGTMVSCRDGLGYGGRNDLEIDVADSEFDALYELAEQVQWAAAEKAAEVYLVERCGCWTGHDLTEVEAGECEQSYEALLFGQDDDTFGDGSSYAIEFPIDGNGDLESTEGVAALLEAGMAADRWTSIYSLMKAYVEAGMPNVTAFIDWSIQGYSQSDWAEGYAYMTADDFTDPEAALKAECEEYAAYFRGDCYLAVREVYIDGESEDYDVVGGFYGDEHIEDVLAKGDI